MSIKTFPIVENSDLANIRNFFKEGLNSELTQGSVFFGSYVEDYCNLVNYGLIITARCDISQDKAPIYSYLPLVSFDNWLCVDFPSILYKKIKKSVYNNLVSSFINIGGSELLLKTYHLDDLVEKFDTEGKIKQRDKFKERVDEYKLLLELEQGEISLCEIKIIAKTFNKETESILNELISQNLLGYYFVDDVTKDGAHIVKLRDVYHIKSDYAKGLRMGIKLPNIDWEDYDDSYTVGEISSPYIEHILQKFSSLFVRIGIDDPDKKFIIDLVGE